MDSIRPNYSNNKFIVNTTKNQSSDNVNTSVVKIREGFQKKLAETNSSKDTGLISDLRSSKLITNQNNSTAKSSLTSVIYNNVFAIHPSTSSDEISYFEDQATQSSKRKRNDSINEDEVYLIDDNTPPSSKKEKNSGNDDIQELDSQLSIHNRSESDEYEVIQIESDTDTEKELSTPMSQSLVSSSQNNRNDAFTILNANATQMPLPMDSGSAVQQVGEAVFARYKGNWLGIAISSNVQRATNCVFQLGFDNNNNGIDENRPMYTGSTEKSALEALKGLMKSAIDPKQPYREVSQQIRNHAHFQRQSAQFNLRFRIVTVNSSENIRGAVARIVRERTAANQPNWNMTTESWEKPASVGKENKMPSTNTVPSKTINNYFSKGPISTPPKVITPTSGKASAPIPTSKPKTKIDQYFTLKQKK